MNSTRWMIAGVVLSWFAGSSGQSLAASDAVHGVCASTPAAAMIAASDSRANGANTADASALAGAHGYRVASVRRDLLQRQSWAVIASCDHPERPSVTMLMDLPVRRVLPTVSDKRTYASVPIVRAGDVVRLWKNDRYAHIEMIATSEENGAVGARVRVRLATTNTTDGQVTQPLYFAGVVRGPANVEMEP